MREKSCGAKVEQIQHLCSKTAGKRRIIKDYMGVWNWERSNNCDQINNSLKKNFYKL